MRILHLAWELPPGVHGGVGRHVHGLAVAQAEDGHDVTVLTGANADAPFDEDVDGVRVLRVLDDPPVIAAEDHLARTLAAGHAWVRAGLREADHVKPDVLHAHDWQTCHAATALREALHLPLVATLHATEAGRHHGWLPTAYSRTVHTTEWWLTYQARRVLTCSEAMRSEVTRLFDLPRDKVDMVPSAVDVSAWASTPARTAAARRACLDREGAEPSAGPLVVFAGRLETQKGVPTLLDAAPRLRRRFPGLRVVLAGQGVDEPELRRQVGRLRQSAVVTFAGQLAQPDLAALLAAADVVVMPSLYEPFGMVALEAAAARTPLVVAETGGLREIVEPGVTGGSFPAGDAEALADAVAAMLTDQVLARRTVRAAYRRVTRDLRWSLVAERVVASYELAVEEESALQAGLAAAVARPLRAVVREGNLLA
jgi:glycogen synthase